MSTRSCDDDEHAPSARARERPHRGDEKVTFNRRVSIEAVFNLLSTATSFARTSALCGRFDGRGSATASAGSSFPLLSRAVRSSSARLRPISVLTCSSDCAHARAHALIAARRRGVRDA
eukprot:2350996-Pleurochrysis_carterae.AAC.5